MINSFRLPSWPRNLMVEIIIKVIYSKLKEQPNEKAHKTAVIANIHCLLKIIHYLLVNDK